MSFNPERAYALRTAIHNTLGWLRHHTGDTATLLTEHLALLHEAELIYLTDAFVDEGEEQVEDDRSLGGLFVDGKKIGEIRSFDLGAQPSASFFSEPLGRAADDTADPHAELRKTWKLGQRWQFLDGDTWLPADPVPKWNEGHQYRRHPDDVETPGGDTYADYKHWANQAAAVGPHTELFKTWRPNQRWQTRPRGAEEWQDISAVPLWLHGHEYRRHPDDIEQPKAAAQPWYPDDSSEWVEGSPRDLPPETLISAILYDYERNHQTYSEFPRSLRVDELSHTISTIVAYQVVKP